MTLRQFHKKCMALCNKLYNERALSLQSNAAVYVSISIFSADGEDCKSFTAYNSFSKKQVEDTWLDVLAYISKEFHDRRLA